MDEQHGILNALRRRGNLLNKGRAVPDIGEDSSPDDEDSQVASGDEDTYDLGGPISGPYSTRSRTGSLPQSGPGQHTRFNSSDFQAGGSMASVLAGRSHGHVRFHSNGSISDVRSSGMQIELPSRSGSMVRPGGANSPRSGSGSPMELSSRPGSRPVSRAGSPGFFDFDRDEAPEASFGGPLVHPQFPPGPSGQGSSTRPRAPSNLRKNFETESDQDEYQPPGSGKKKHG
jgi:hypothetical protein